jgi:hypothetical protein
MVDSVVSFRVTRYQVCCHRPGAFLGSTGIPAVLHIRIGCLFSAIVASVAGMLGGGAHFRVAIASPLCLDIVEGVEYVQEGCLWCWCTLWLYVTATTQSAYEKEASCILYTLCSPEGLHSSCTMPVIVPICTISWKPQTTVSISPCFCLWYQSPKHNAVHRIVNTPSPQMYP